jgi:hypothetical protein
MSKGLILYVPPSLPIEIASRKNGRGLKVANSSIIDEIVKDAQLGRETRKLMRGFGFL